MLPGFVRRDPPAVRWKYLARVTLFEGLNPRELRVLDGLLHERSYLKDEIIFDEGEEGQAIYIILTGKVAICRQGRRDDGHIAQYGPGDFFGDLALLDNSPRIAQARAVEDSRLAVFFRGDFVGLLETHSTLSSKLSLTLARLIGKRLREATLALTAYKERGEGA